MIKAGLDIGNSKISCVVADYKNSENINVLSISSIPTNNIKKNVILNHKSLLEQIQSLIIENEKKSQTKINSINLNFSWTRASIATSMVEKYQKIISQQISEDFLLSEKITRRDLTTHCFLSRGKYLFRSKASINAFYRYFMKSIAT